MNKFIFVAYLSIFAIGCGNRKAVVTVAIVNGSDVKQSLDLATFLNGNLVDSRSVEKDSIKEKYSIFKVDVVDKGKPSVIQFKIRNTNEVTNCTLVPDSLTSRTVIRVYYIETLFKKGWRYETITLDRDSVVKRIFTCQVLYNGGNFID